jgi:hypothetical protein
MTGSYGPKSRLVRNSDQIAATLGLTQAPLARWKLGSALADSLAEPDND